MKEVLASWTAEFQHETNFAPIRQLYDSLRKEGVSFIAQVMSGSSCLLKWISSEVVLYELCYLRKPTTGSFDLPIILL